MIVGELPRLKDELSSLSGKDYVYAMDKMMAYVAPKPTEVSIDGELKTDTTITKKDAEILSSIPVDVIANITEQLQASMTTTASVGENDNEGDDINEEAE